MRLICRICGAQWNERIVDPIIVDGKEVLVCPDCLQELLDAQEEMTEAEYLNELKAQRADEEYDRRKVEGF